MTDASVPVRFSLNGQPVELSVEPNALMLDVLRERFGLTGAKRSCDMQICGTCTVLVDGEPTSSCTTLACEADGRTIETVEGIASDGVLHPLQQAFIEHGALQCGFCTPGMIMSAKALLERCPDPSRDEIVAYMDGNICRCTGYFKIIEAIEAAARPPAGGSATERA